MDIRKETSSQNVRFHDQKIENQKTNQFSNFLTCLKEKQYAENYKLQTSKYTEDPGTEPKHE